MWNSGLTSLYHKYLQNHFLLEPGLTEDFSGSDATSSSGESSAEKEEKQKQKKTRKIKNQKGI